MGKILFRIGQIFQHRTRFGEVANLFQGCYFKGAELGYNDGDIYFEWPMKVQFNNEYRKQIYFPCPKYSILPIKFINRKDVVLTEFSEIKNLVDKGVFYENSPPLYIGDSTNPSIQHQNYLGPMDYLNKYYYETGRRPIFEIPKNNTNKYILFHFRNTIWSTYRNPNPKVFMDIFNNLKDKYGNKFKFVKIGEPWRTMDRKFDYVAPYFNDLNKLIKIINNCSIFITSSSGPNAYGDMLNIPMIELDIPKFTDSGREGERTEAGWKEYGGKYGKTYFDWRDKERYLLNFKNEPIDFISIFNFIDRWA